MSKKTTRLEKLFEIDWEPTEGLQVFEKMTYKTLWKGKTKGKRLAGRLISCVVQIKDKTMSKKTTRIEKLIETPWKPTAGLQAFEEVTYAISWEKNPKGKPEEKRKEISRFWGFRKENGEIVIPPIYTYVRKFEEGISKVCYKDKWGVINTSGETAVPFIYQVLHLTSDGLLQVQLDGKWGCLRRDGTTVIEPQWEYIFPFRGLFAGIKQQGKYGFIRLDGKVIIAPCFDEIGQISPDRTVKVRTGSQWEEIVLTASGND